MRLDEYLKTKGISKKNFAQLIGVTPAHITNICNGWKSPSLLLARRIIEETNGEVNVSDLFYPKVSTRLKKWKEEIKSD